MEHCAKNQERVSIFWFRNQSTELIHHHHTECLYPTYLYLISYLSSNQTSDARPQIRTLAPQFTMSSNFYTSSHNRYHIHPRTVVYQARAIDRLYASPDQLLCLSIWFANLIQKVGKRLLLRQVPIATATIYFKRFYLKNSYCETNPYLVLAACLFVAAKVEETPVHIKSVVSEAKAVFTGEFTLTSTLCRN